MTKIVVNGRKVDVVASEISYEDACKMAGLTEPIPAWLTVTYYCGRTCGMLAPRASVRVQSGLVINVADTYAA